MRKHIKEKITDWGLEIPDDNITIERTDYYASIFIWYEVEKVFFGKWEHVFYFEVEAEGEIKSKEYN